MIRVSRGAEVAALRLERRHRLSVAILSRAEGADVDFAGYGVAKKDLADRLNHKCVYCECPIRPESNPVEHFRPKAFVQNKGEPRDEERYWWLAWTWENLLFACGRCNSSYKGNQFPLEPGTAPLPPLSFDIGAESSALIDPSGEDPRDHIRFKWSPTRTRWVPVARSPKGQKTIQVLGLDDDDKPTEHLERRIVQDVLDDVERAIKGGRKGAVQRAWRKALRALFAPREPFHAVTWDAMDARFPEKLRKRFGIALPTLGSSTRSSSSLPFDPADDPASLAALPEHLKTHVRANPKSATRDSKRRAMRALLAHQSFDDEQLGELLQLDAATIHGYRPI